MEKIVTTANPAFPFSEDHELNIEIKISDNPPNALPGYPQILLQNTQELYPFLLEDLCTPTLEKLAPRLWWMSTQSSAHIAPLHHQAVKLRQIVLSENPELHLIWYYDRIFIKPIPKYLLSHAFWRNYLVPSLPATVSEGECKLIERSALGFLRTYLYLVKYESDFDIAKEKRLIPSEVTWERFSAFKSDLKAIEDAHVTERYHYGEIRLSRLNFYIKFLLGRSAFHNVHGQYSTYFSRFYGPLLFIFGMISLLLSALQVELSVEPLIANQWPRFWALSRWLSVVFAGFILLLVSILLLILVNKILTEWYFAFRDRHRRLFGSLDIRTRQKETV